MAINSILHKNALFLEDIIISEIRDSYKPLFEFALSYVETGTSEKFDELKMKYDKIMELGESPRKKTLKVFKELSGINA